MAEVPTTWRDRTAGESNFRLRKWLPHYLHWYRRGIHRAVAPSRGRRGRPDRGAGCRRAFDGLAAGDGRIGLPAWFVVIDLLWIAKPDVLGIEPDHYQRGATTWLAGGDPWAVTAVGGIPYAAGPHTLLFYAPTSVLPLHGLDMAIWVSGRCRRRRSGSSESCELAAGGSWPSRRCCMAIWNGNPQTIALALLVQGSLVGAVAAVGLKLYAAVPLVTRWRHWSSPVRSWPS